MLNPFQEAFFRVGDVDLFVKQAGDGPALVVVHGGPDWDHSYLLNAVGALTSKYRVILYDHRGCGRSTRLGDSAAYSLDLAVDDLVALMNLLELDHPTLLGFSWGGRVALRLIARYPGLIGKLILASSTAYTQLEQFEILPEHLSRKAGVQPEIDAVFADKTATAAECSERLAYAQASLGVWNQDAVPRLRQLLGDIRWSGEWWKALQAGRLSGVVHPDYGVVLREQAVATLILHGEHDLSFPIGAARQLKAAYPDAVLQEIDGGHFCFLEHPAQWQETVRAFLER